MPTTNADYIVFALVTVGMAFAAVVFSVFAEILSMIGIPNPLKGFLLVARPIVENLGRYPPAPCHSFGTVLGVSFFWPLTLAPVHFLNFRVLGWPPAACVPLIFLSGFVTAVVALYSVSSRRW